MLENFKFKKSLGQNFISDTNFLNAIVADAGVTAEDSVLEIGAGAGALTQALANVAAKVVAIEKDETLKDLLHSKFITQKNVQLIFGDFLQLNKTQLESFLKTPYKIVANLPYYITTPIIFKIIEEGFAAQSLTIMVQKEVADRLKAKPGTKDYGVITAKINLIADVEVVRFAPRSLFYPVPNVDSSVVKIIFKHKLSVNNKIYNRVVNCAFRERRKMLLSNLAREFSVDKKAIAQIFEQCGISLTIRGEVLDYAQFAKITEKIEKL